MKGIGVNRLGGRRPAATLLVTAVAASLALGACSDTPPGRATAESSTVPAAPAPSDALRTRLRDEIEKVVAMRMPGAGGDLAPSIDHVIDELLKSPTIVASLEARFGAAPPPELHPLILDGERQVRDLGFVRSVVGATLVGSQERSWNVVQLNAPGTISSVASTSNCIDARLEYTPAETLRCALTSLAIRRDVVMHVFDATGQEVAAKRNGSVALPAGSYYVTVHPGPSGFGVLGGTITSTGAPASVAFETAGVPIDLSKLNDGTHHYDLETVLRLDPGGANQNEGLGADATELWMLDDSFKLKGGDFAQSGVGPAARMGHAEASKARWAIVRPWSLRGAAGLPAALPNGLAKPSATKTQGNIGSGRVRVVFNDWYDHDADHDGLADGVEQEVGLCGGTSKLLPNGVVCPAWSSVALGASLLDPRDTDGDGLTDTAEVLGSDGKAWQCPPPGCAGPNPDADQTLPLWGADPLHKDLFLEVDTVPRSKHVNQCPNFTDPTQPVMAASGGSARLGQYQPNNLYRYREIFATVQDAGNPDGAPGINTHFDIDLGEGVYAKHGHVRRFDPVATDYYSPAPQHDLVTVSPRGSTCGGQGDVTQSPSHIGYFHYAVVDSDGLAGGTTKPCGGTITAGADGVTMAHETGHRLGLTHGGPDMCSPYHGPAGDSASTTKVVQFSPMSYVYQPQDNVDVFFPAIPAPTEPIPDLQGRFFEHDPGHGRDMTFLAGDSLPPPGNRSWGLSVSNGVDVDFNLDGIAGGAPVSGIPVDALAGRGNAYVALRTDLFTDSRPSVHSTAPAQCDCTGNTCQYQTMTLAGPPVGVVGAGAAQLVWPYAIQAPSDNWNPAAVLVVAKTSAVHKTLATPCQYRFDSCATPDSEPMPMSLGIAGHPISVAGPWSGGAAALSDGAVAFAWTSATVPGGMNSGQPPNAWTAAQLAFAPSGDLALPLTSVALPALLPGEGAEVDAVAIAASDENGGTERATLVVRSASTQHLSATTCAQAGCDPFVLVRDGANNPITSYARPALATRRRAGGGADLYLVVGSAGAWMAPVRAYVRGALAWNAAPMTLAPIPLTDSSLSATFTGQFNADPSDDRLVIAYEQDFLPGLGGIHMKSTKPGALDFVDVWDTMEFGEWAYSRDYANQQFPGVIPTFFEGDPATTDAFLKGHVRAAVPLGGSWKDCKAEGIGDGVTFSASAAGEFQPAEYQYVEDSTLAWGLCNQLGQVAASDLVDTTVPFRCGALQLGSVFANVLIPALEQAVCTSCPQPCPACGLELAIRDLVTNPWWLARPPTVSGVNGPPAPTRPGAACSLVTAWPGMAPPENFVPNGGRR